MKEFITKEQWDEISDSQKTEFQTIISRKYKPGQVPNYDDIDDYLEEVELHHNLFQGIDEGQAPPIQSLDIDILWEKVKKHLD